MARDFTGSISGGVSLSERASERGLVGACSVADWLALASQWASRFSLGSVQENGEMNFGMPGSTTGLSAQPVFARF